MSNPVGDHSGMSEAPQYNLDALPEAWRLKTAVCWLERGQPDAALRELEYLSAKAWKHPRAVRIRCAALRALRDLGGGSKMGR